MERCHNLEWYLLQFVLTRRIAADHKSITYNTPTDKARAFNEYFNSIVNIELKYSLKALALSVGVLYVMDL